MRRSNDRRPERSFRVFENFSLWKHFTHFAEINCHLMCSKGRKRGQKDRYHHSASAKFEVSPNSLPPNQGSPAPTRSWIARRSKPVGLVKTVCMCVVDFRSGTKSAEHEWLQQAARRSRNSSKGPFSSAGGGEGRPRQVTVGHPANAALRGYSSSFQPAATVPPGQRPSHL